MAINQINVTFKKTEMDLAEFLATKSSKSGYIKDAIREKMQRELHGAPGVGAGVDAEQKESQKNPVLSKGKKTLSQFIDT